MVRQGDGLPGPYRIQLADVFVHLFEKLVLMLNGAIVSAAIVGSFGSRKLEHLLLGQIFSINRHNARLVEIYLRRN
jgi:hypothetical protein